MFIILAIFLALSTLLVHGAPSITQLNITINKTGAGFTILRNMIGSSPNNQYHQMVSIEPTSPGSPTAPPRYIALPDGDQDQVWVSQQALARGLQTIYANAWSADGYMKTQGTDYNGGYICGVTNAPCASGDWRQAYANKVVQYLKDYTALGIPINYVGFLNEPDLNMTYASMQSSGQQAADFLKILYPTLQASNLSTKIACCNTSGWERNRARITGIQQAGYEYTLDVVTSHGYTSPPGSPFATTKRVWQTEWATFTAPNLLWYNSSSDPSEGLTWATHLATSFTTSNVSAFFYWLGAAPTADNSQLIYVVGDTVAVSKRLWAFAHWGRFVRTGARRVDAVVVGGEGVQVVAWWWSGGGGGGAGAGGILTVQVVNNGDARAMVGLGGVNITPGQMIPTYLTDNSNDLTPTNTTTVGSDGSLVGNVPPRSLVSFVIPVL